MTQFADRFGTPLLAALALMLVAAAFVVSDGYLLVDEFVYVLTATAFGSGTPFFLENGTDQFSSPDLVFFNLVAGPNGLVSQYPVGTDIVAGPLVAMLGPRGLIVANALAAGGTLFLTRAIAWRLYRDRAVALGAALILGLCSFLADYALAIWPHALSLFFCAATILAALRALDAGARADMGFAALAGLMAGAAALVRMDSILILPVLGAVLIVYAARPVRLAVAGAAGLAPALALGSYANHLKFDTCNPISYGASNGGGVDLATHTGPIIALAAGLAVLAGLRQLTWRPAWRWPVVIGVAATGALLWALVPQVQTAVARYAFGFDTLIVDVRGVPDGRGGIIDRPDGTVSFWGLPKKALGQSLPWIAFLAVVFLRPWGERRRAHLFCLAALGIWTLPFIMIAWHGGPGSSTRYFLGLLPILSTFGALALADLLALANRGVRPLVLGFGLGATLVLVWPLAGPGGYFGAHQVLPTYLLIAGFAVALIISGLPRPATALAGQGVLAAGLGMAAMLGIGSDVPNAQHQRAGNAVTQAVLSAARAPSLIIAPPESVAFQMARENALTAFPREGRPLDMGLIDDALAAGYAVYLTPQILAEAQHRDPTLAQIGAPIGGDAAWALQEVGK